MRSRRPPFLSMAVALVLGLGLAAHALLWVGLAWIGPAPFSQLASLFPLKLERLVP